MSKAKVALLIVLMAVSGIIGSAAGGLMISPETVVAQENESINANSFRVFDKNDNVKIILTTAGDNGDPAIILYDDNGKERIIFSVSGNREPHFSLWDTKGKVRMAAAVMKDGDSSFEMLDMNGRVIWSKP